MHDGLEYVVVGDGTELRFTLLRVGRLSLLFRTVAAPESCGPTVPVTGRSSLACSAEYAVLLHRGDWRAAECYGVADALLVPFERA